MQHIKTSILLLFLLLSLALQAQQQGRIFAVLVGVSEYADAQQNLAFAHRDAREMYNMLRLQTHRDNLRLITNRAATHRHILQTTSELFAKSTPDDVVIFFFAGHGYRGKFFAHDRPIYFHELQYVFRQARANRKIIFADACNAGDLRDGESARQTESNDNSLEREVMLFLSSRQYQYSLEMGRLRNGVFTYFLLAGLRGGADANRDRLITARELFDFVNPRVRRHTDGTQVPVMWGRFDDDMVILDWNRRN